MEVLLATRYMDFRNAGIGRVSSSILKGLSKRGFEPHWISTEGSSLYSYFYYTLVELPLHMASLGKFDIYHALTPMEGIWMPKKKTVVTFYDFIPITDLGKAGSGLNASNWVGKVGQEYFRFACRIVSKASGIACISQQTKDELVTLFKVKPERAKVIRLGISEDLIPKPKKDKTLRIGYLGQLDRRKRVDILVSAFHKSKLDAELTIGGIGPDRQALEFIADEDPRIKFLGLVPDLDLPDFYNSLDILAFPTGVEGYGLPIIEAMACGKPVVVLWDAKIPWEVKQGCFMTDNLGQFLIKDLEWSIAHNKTEDNLEFARKHNWDSCVEEYIKLYKEVSS